MTIARSPHKTKSIIVDVKGTFHSVSGLHFSEMGHTLAWEFGGTGGSYTGRMLFDGEITTPSEHTGLYVEVFGQNNSQSNTPRGTYPFGGFYRQFTEPFGLDGAMRFGLTDHSASIGTTNRLVFGNRLHANPDSNRPRA